MIEAYFDESGTHDDSPVICVAGYLYESEKCGSLDLEWQAMLEKWGLPYFRMVDCAHGNKPFDKLSPEQCISAEKDAIRLIRKYMTHGIAITACESDYNEAIKTGDPFGAAYAWCCWMCFIAVEKWADKHDYNGGVAYFFETGHKYQGRTNALVEEIIKIDKLRKSFRYASHAFAGKTELRPLQTADILAWQSATFTKNRLSGERGPRADLIALIKNGKTRDFHATKADFEGFQVWLSGLPEEYRESLLRIVT